MGSNTISISISNVNETESRDGMVHLLATLSYNPRSEEDNEKVRVAHALDEEDEKRQRLVVLLHLNVEVAVANRHGRSDIKRGAG